MSSIVQQTDADRIKSLAGDSWRMSAIRPLRFAMDGIQRFPRLVRRVVSPVVSMLCESTTLGMLRRADIDQMVADSYNSLPQFYDPRTYSLPYEQRMLPTLKRLARGQRMLDAFCGQGREAELFVASGFIVTAVDRLAWMIDAANQYADEKGFVANFVAADFAELDQRQKYDVVYTSCWMYSTCQGADRRRTLLTKCRNLCNDDGVIVISTVERPRGKNVGAMVRFVLAKCVAILTLGNLRSEFGERTYSSLFWHHFSDSEVRREIEASQLTVLDVVKGSGIDPTFYFLSIRQPKDESSGGGRA